MTAQKVSVIIVSQGRPEHLARCLESLHKQTHPSFEVVVVADNLPPDFASSVRYIPFEKQNIAAARNLGISNSTADIIAFCDDDAIPDPPWLERLITPFETSKIGSTTGFTRGRNGISRQWGAFRFDRDGNDLATQVDETAPFTIFPADTNTPVKLLGTNMAFRKTALMAVSGFDAAFHFFLEDADIKLQLDSKNWECAIVPSAQIHHRYAASPRRSQNRIPTDLHEIGASKAYFCRKHNPQNIDTALERFEGEQQQRLTAMLAVKHLTQANVDTLMQSLRAGFARGMERETSGDISAHPPEFNAFQTCSGSHILLCATVLDRKWMRKTARDLTDKGHRISVVYLMPTTFFFQVSFKDGYWLHKGGVWGKSQRSQPLIQLITHRKRFSQEARRIDLIHPIDEIRFRNSTFSRDEAHFLT